MIDHASVYARRGKPRARRCHFAGGVWCVPRTPYRGRGIGVADVEIAPGDTRWVLWQDVGAAFDDAVAEANLTGLAVLPIVTAVVLAVEGVDWAQAVLDGELLVLHVHARDGDRMSFVTEVDRWA